MDTIYNSNLKSHLSLDGNKKVRYINHSQTYWLADSNNPRKAAIQYLHSFADTLQIPKKALENITQKVDYLNPQQREMEYRLSDEKQFFDSMTYGFNQTYLNIPIWRAGLSVTIKQNPSRIVLSADTSLINPSAKLPDEKIISRYRELFSATQPTRAVLNKGVKNESFNDAGSSFVASLFETASKKESSSRKSGDVSATVETAARFNRGRFYIYQYDESARLPHSHAATTHKSNDLEKEGYHPTLPLPPVPATIKNGSSYLVAEVLFTRAHESIGNLNWIALVELETNAVLYLRALIDGVDGLVFTYDPITSTGVLTNTAAQNNATLNPLRDNVTLEHLDAPVGGTQSLRGTYVQVRDDDAPTVAPPTRPAGSNFEYDTRTNNFAAVSAYYHADQLFELIEDLGFPVATYFDGTAFPVIVDHRASTSGTTGIEINAFCAGDAQNNGIGLVGFCLNDTTDTVNPIGRAVDKWVHWHEVGGHGILWDHVNSPNFGFAHSAGDGLAALQNDPESLLRGLPERFRYAPFRAGLDRWFNRPVTSGWAWGGTNDTNGYNSEQILATTIFRIYQSLGGDADSVSRRWFASRMVTYLVLRAVGTLTPATNPGNALGFCNTLMAVDLLNWTTEGLSGGAYNKVIRWAFEKQGLFQPAAATPPFTAAGAPPAVDVYVDDGRHGEYQYKYDHWNNLSVWNRNSADGNATHQPAIIGATNYAYVKVKNRGTATANNVRVKGYHCLPGAGLVWPGDFVAMNPAAGLTVSSIGANNSEEVTVGPFEWIPNENIYGHDCLLLIASADGDPSNIDNFTAGETIQEWRLVPHDNNIAQRNVSLVPGGEGSEGMVKGLQGAIFYAGNPSRRRAQMELKVTLPKLLRAHGWRVTIQGLKENTFALSPGEKRKLVIDLIEGTAFTREQLKGSDDRVLELALYADGILLGGNSYHIDPDLKELPSNPERDRGRCLDQADALLKCLKIDGKHARKVSVKKVNLDIELSSNDCCE